MKLARLVIIIFATLPATYISLLTPLVFIKAVRDFDISNIESILFFLWPIGGILGVVGLWIISIKNKPDKLLTTFLLVVGIISSIYALIWLGYSFTYSFHSLINPPGILLLHLPVIISVIYLLCMWLQPHLTRHSKGAPQSGAS